MQQQIIYHIGNEKKPFWTSNGRRQFKEFPVLINWFDWSNYYWFQVSAALSSHLISLRMRSSGGPAHVNTLYDLLICGFTGLEKILFLHNGWVDGGENSLVLVSNHYTHFPNLS